MDKDITEFIKYPHVERHGTPEVDGIEVGECFVFPKLDGTLASSFLGEDGFIQAGSRNRHLSLDADNFDFLKWVKTQESMLAPLWKFFQEFGWKYRLYGEFLVPHSFKAYRDNVWRRFWIFDVLNHETGKWVPYDEYSAILESFELDFIPPLAKVKNPTNEQLLKLVNANTFLVKDGEGPGEGIVIKRYDFINKYSRTTWAKMVRNEFKEMNQKAFGVAEKGEEFQPEVAIAEAAVTAALVEKERSKIEAVILQEYLEGLPEMQKKSFNEDRKKLILHQEKRRIIPRLLETVYHCVVTEELWPMLKRLKDPTVDFRKLRKFVIHQTKKHIKDMV